MKILAAAEKNPIDDGIREELRFCLVILTAGRNRDPIVDVFCGSGGATNASELRRHFTVASCRRKYDGEWGVISIPAGQMGVWQDIFSRNKHDHDQRRKNARRCSPVSEIRPSLLALISICVENVRRQAGRKGDLVCYTRVSKNRRVCGLSVSRT
jgi:hypothetical protein